MTIIYIRESDLEAYVSQGWVCYRLRGHHGARANGRNFICLLNE
jgi:hypothetical protein